MENEEVLEPTIKGYREAFLALCNLLKNGVLHETEYFVLDLYARMTANMRIEELLFTMTKKQFIIVKEGRTVRFVPA